MTAGLLFVPLTSPSISNTFTPVSGATLQVNITGGSTAASLFSDPALAHAITNPQTSDSSGRFFQQSTTIFADASQSYDAVLTFPDGESFTFTGLPLIALGVSTAGLAPLASPAFTGVPTAPTPSLSDSSSKIATTAFVKGQNYAPLNSPALSGDPTAPTASPGTSTTQIATTAFVTSALGFIAPASSSSGYTKIGTLYIQWAPFSLGSAPSSTTTVTWPTPFPNAVVGYPWCGFQTPGYTIQMSSITTTSVLLTKSSIDSSARSGTVYAFGF